MVPPPATFSELRSQFKHVLQAVQAQSGSQPKIAKVPPLLPEFSTIITRDVPIQGQIDTLPTAKKPSSNRIESSRMKGGCDSRAPLDSDKSMEGVKVVSETWGVYHSPEEFVAKAVEAGHPHGMKQCLPEVLSNAIRRNRELNAAKRVEHRTAKITQWVQWASELAPQEQELKASMLGMYNLSFVDKIKVSQANKLYRLTAQMVKFAVVVTYSYA